MPRYDLDSDDVAGPASATPGGEPMVLAYADPALAPPRSPSARCARLSLVTLIAWLPAMYGASALKAFEIAAPLGISLPVLALVFAFAARVRADAGSADRRASILPLALSLAACALLVGLSALTPSLNSRGPSNEVKCASHLRQIGQDILMYANDHQGQFPPSLGVLFTEQDMSADIVVCPSTTDAPTTATTTQQVARDIDATPGRRSYVYVGAGMTTTKATAAHVVAYEPFANHPGQGMNVLFGDGHAEWLTHLDATHLTAELTLGHNPPRPRPAK